MNRIPKEFYTKEEVMNFAYYAYKRQQVEHNAFKGIKFPTTLEINVSHVHENILVRYEGKLCGTIDLLTEHITYTK